MSVNQIQENIYYTRAESMFELTSNLEILVETEAILSSTVIYHIDKESLQKVLQIKFTFKDTITP
jgi:hypothetical protein